MAGFELASLIAAEITALPGVIFPSATVRIYLLNKDSYFHIFPKTISAQFLIIKVIKAISIQLMDFIHVFFCLFFYGKRYF